MKLAGDLAEISLADLVQVSGLARRTCRVRTLTPAGNGVLYLEEGAVVAAEFEDLTGFDAFVTLLAARQGHFQVEHGVHPPVATMTMPLQRLLLEANARIEAGTVPIPRRRRVPGNSPPASPAVGSITEGMAPHPRSRRSWFFGGLALALGTVAWLAFVRQENLGGIGTPHGPVPGREAARTPTYEAAQLTGPHDALPVAVAERPPVPPDRRSGFKPTIVCRILVGTDGTVRDAKIYRSRLDLAAYEDAALDAVHGTRFTAGQRDGNPAAVWLNYPVVFR